LGVALVRLQIADERGVDPWTRDAAAHCALWALPDPVLTRAGSGSGGAACAARGIDASEATAEGRGTARDTGCTTSCAVAEGIGATHAAAAEGAAAGGATAWATTAAAEATRRLSGWPRGRDGGVGPMGHRVRGPRHRGGQQ